MFAKGGAVDDHPMSTSPAGLILRGATAEERYNRNASSGTVEAKDPHLTPRVVRECDGTKGASRRRPWVSGWGNNWVKDNLLNANGEMYVEWAKKSGFIYRSH